LLINACGQARQGRPARSASTFAHGEPGAKKTLAGVAAGTGKTGGGDRHSHLAVGLLAAINSATQFTDMPPPSATLCRRCKRMSSGLGDLSRLYKTTDACQSWTLLFTNPDKNGLWDALQFNDRDQTFPYSKQDANGVLLGDPVNGVFAIFVTRNTGDTWTRWNEADPKHLPRAQRGESMFAASNEAVVAPGSNGPFAFVTGGKDSRIYLSQPHRPFDMASWYALSNAALPSMQQNFDSLTTAMP